MDSFSRIGGLGQEPVPSSISGQIANQMTVHASASHAQVYQGTSSTHY